MNFKPHYFNKYIWEDNLIKNVYSQRLHLCCVHKEKIMYM